MAQLALAAESPRPRFTPLRQHHGVGATTRYSVHATTQQRRHDVRRCQQFEVAHAALPLAVASPRPHLPCHGHSDGVQEST